MDRVAIYYNKEFNPTTKIPVKILCSYLSNNKFGYFLNPNINTLNKYSSEILFAISYGGDGLLINMAHLISCHNIPIIGVNYGKVGYLCRIHPDYDIIQINKIIHDIEYNQLKTENRTRISAEINGKIVADALNDISIGGINRTVYLDLKFITNKTYCLKSIGDGIIFSTRTGSTAYNVNAGGSVVLDNNIFSIVANNSIFKSEYIPINTKSITTSTDTVFEVRIANKNKDNIPCLVADGQRTILLNKDDIITIRKSQYTTDFIVI